MTERVTLKPGDYVSTKGMTEDQYHAVARAFMAAGAREPSQALPWNQWRMVGWCEQDGLYHSDSSVAYYGEKRRLSPAQVIGATNSGGKAQDTITGALKYACDELDTARQHDAKAKHYAAEHDRLMQQARSMLPDGWRLVRDGIPADVYRSFDDQTRRMMREEDMADPANWQEGDVVMCIDDRPDHCHVGMLYTVNRGAEGDRLSIKADDDGDAGIPPLKSFRFHHRPT